MFSLQKVTRASENVGFFLSKPTSLHSLLQALKEDIISRKPDRDGLVNLAKDLNTEAEIDQPVVEKEAELLAKRYDDLTVVIKDKEERLSRLIAKSEKYHATLAPVEELFSKVEQAVSNQSPFGADVEQAEGELEIVKVFEYLRHLRAARVRI